jgi:thioredoxin reductase
LSAAFYLARAGHAVEIFEASFHPGGMLRHAIPEYRLPQSVLEEELQLFHDLGVVFRTGMRLGQDFALDDLFESEYEAVLLALGTSGSRELNVPGESLTGVHQALDLLGACRMRDLFPEPALSGKVVVIGGGNVAVDAAMSARRLGAAEVVMICLEGPNQMPAHAWEIEQATEEGIQIKNGWGPTEFIGENGHLKRVRFKRCMSVFDNNGRFNPAYDESDTMEWEADHAVIAIGQKLEPLGLKGEPGVVVNPQGVLAVDSENYQTGREGVFAAGDAVAGPSSVIQAVAEGRKVAEAMDKYLGGTGLLSKAVSVKLDPHLGRDEEFHMRHAARPLHTPPEERVHGFALLEASLTQAEAVQESLRCLRCNLRATITPVVLPPDRWLNLSLEALTKIPPVEGVIQIAGSDRKPVRIAGVQDVRTALESECRNRTGDWLFCWEADHMYSKRESELIQQHLQAYGEMPGGGAGELDDLF